jgi:Cu-Zn family superoxide dismutase
MVKLGVFFAGVFLVLAGNGAWAGSEPGAHADIKDTAGKSIGTAQLTQQPEGVRIRVRISGLAPGKHGFHLHETGSCTTPDFKSAGGHFNPFQKHHGILNPQGKHAGDIPNLEVREDGSAELTLVASELTLNDGPNSVFKPGGTALVIHANPDDDRNDPAGNAGARIACGVIVKAKNGQ